MQNEEFKEAVKENDESTVEQILFDCGIDTSLPYEIVSCEHRVYPSTDNPLSFNGPLVQGTERCDEAWVKSENSSWEVQVESSNDPSLRAELKWIGRQGSCDRTWQDNNVAKRVAKSEQVKGV
ncbi:hypothetical protein D3C85_812390 [compost metagenome]